jgi:hypothetical protein
MSTPFEIDDFQGYLDTVRNELPKGRIYFRGQSRLVSAGYELKPSIGRYKKLESLTLFERDEKEREVLGVFTNHLLTYVHHLPRNDWESLAIAQHHGLPTRFMDWTTNPLVALYFAARETEADENDRPLNSAVYVLTSEPPRYADLVREKQPEVTPVPDTLTMLAQLEEDNRAELVDAYSMPGSEPPLQVESPKQRGTASPEVLKELAQCPFEITENVIYDPPHVSPRIRAQDGVLLACHQPMQPLEEKDYLEIVIKHQAHDDIRRRLDQYGVFDKQLFPDLDGIA